eukprot:3608626-Rhodomonas_salina.2
MVLHHLRPEILWHPTFSVVQNMRKADGLLSEKSKCVGERFALVAEKSFLSQWSFECFPSQRGAACNNDRARHSQGPAG